MSDDLMKRLLQPTGLNAFTREPVQNKLNVAAANRIEELEAKLAMAVDFIEDLEGHQWPLDVQAKRVLKELKGRNDEYAEKWED